MSNLSNLANMILSQKKLQYVSSLGEGVGRTWQTVSKIQKKMQRAKNNQDILEIMSGLSLTNIKTMTKL